MIRVERLEGGVGRITIDRPEARNALTFAMWDQLRDAALTLDADPAVRAVVITGGGGGAFASGTDIAEFRGFTGEDGVAYEARMERVMAALEAIRVPTIAAIAGACTGGGAAAAACCDLRIGAPSARIGVPVARTLGNALSARNLARVAALIGFDAAKAMLLTARLFDAGDALRAGFLSEFVLSEGALQPRVLAVAGELASLAPLTLRATKETCRRVRATIPVPDDTDLLRAIYGSADFREGVDAFVARRGARWTGA